MLTKSHNVIEMTKEFADYVRLKYLKVYGLTHDIADNMYMLVFDEFGFRRKLRFGKCENCNRANTSPTWCQTCDPQKTTQGWASGNKIVDDCIKNFNLKPQIIKR